MRPVARLLLSLLGALALIAGSMGAAAAALPAPGRTSVVEAAPQGLDDFTFDSWHSDFRLGLADDGRSTLTTTETIVARFPEIDQNRGIRRAIPTHYDGHPTDLAIESVTDGRGAPRDYETETSDDGGRFLVVTIAADDFVHGPQTYTIRYRQANVTLFPSDSDDEEFYWEVNGTGWAQPFGEVSATLQVAPELVPKLTGATSCYQGDIVSSEPCATLASEADGDGWRVDVNAGGLAPHQGLTLAVGFQAGTFVPRDDSFTASPFPGIGLAAALLGLAGMVVAGIARLGSWRSQPGRPTIIAEYLPPTGVNLLEAADVARATTKAMAAQFLSFAVRGNVRVLEVEGKKHYQLELERADRVDEAERSILARLFPGLQPGTRRDLKARDAKLSLALQRELRASRKRMITAGLREKKGGALRGWLIALAVATGAVSIGASAIAIGSEIGGAWPILILVLGGAFSGGILALTASVRPLTAAGAELRDYLKGVKVYIALAEADRLRVLQSPEGALRSPYRPDPAALPADSGPGGTLQVLKLYERLLPFAVLFGQEKQWSRVLGEYYEASGSQPGWYSGPGGFNAGLFAAGIGSFASTTSASWSGSSSSSSGSGGGGSVGGGGGGGGGGGV
ncbi:DUF2207 domain-containing protein [Cryobacterium tagatosivorans]|uniref:DUF2207 domain-containing protein n=1 Tax=Cryobacterium tagatosivorans TaxID=1259199 RepID=A0A4R8UDP3_9MICO|nr:DUF2207 domain-containing protein [Cryobacterium tagatosivorans]TFB48411.1 DUF2207 domain-containing protein [Cryobacterium tagatosivorans]